MAAHPVFFDFKILLHVMSVPHLPLAASAILASAPQTEHYSPGNVPFVERSRKRIILNPDL